MNVEPPYRFAGRLAARHCLLLLAVVFMVACQSGPPVQEMSDARQAIAVAREAGAEITATDELRAAEAHLQRAERRLSEKAYSQARRDALEAKRSALDALSISDGADSDDTP